jgi:RNA polymerase sigma factor (sigma-70 family)
LNTTEFNTIVRQWSPHLLRFARRQLNSMDTAKDAVQDAFEVLWKNKDSIDATKAKQYLFTVVFRKGIDSFRMRKNETDIDVLSNVPASSRSIDVTYSDKELVAMALEQLPDLQRQLILLRDLEGYDYNEISEITGLNMSQVKVYLFRARKSMKETITTIEAL